ncbi:hypothetical protein CapIbe_003324 [Capra ibex]
MDRDPAERAGGPQCVMMLLWTQFTVSLAPLIISVLSFRREAGQASDPRLPVWTLILQGDGAAGEDGSSSVPPPPASSLEETGQHETAPSDPLFQKRVLPLTTHRTSSDGALVERGCGQSLTGRLREDEEEKALNTFHILSYRTCSPYGGPWRGVSSGDAC